MSRKKKSRLTLVVLVIGVSILGVWFACHLHSFDINAAVRANDTAGVKLLLLLGKSPNDKDPHGFCMCQTPLHAAAAMGGPDVMRALLNAGADVNIRDSLGYTPLHLAASMPAYGPAFPTAEHMPSPQDYLTMVRMLVEAGADVNARDKYGYTPLCKANANLSDNRGYAPPVLAYDRSIIRYLLSKGGDPTVRLHTGWPFRTGDNRRPETAKRHRARD